MEPDRKRRPRGDQTRELLIEAAIDLFGRRGLDGVGARELAAAASVPLAAIPYHFGTKDALYRAALQRVAARLHEALAPAARAAGPAAQGAPAEAAAALEALQAALLDAIAVRPEAETWAKLLLREHLDPTDAFHAVADDAAGSAVDLMARLVARARGRDAVDEAALLEAFARMGEVLAFRVLRHAVAHRLGWTSVGDREATQVAHALRPGDARYAH